MSNCYYLQKADHEHSSSDISTPSIQGSDLGLSVSPLPKSRSPMTSGHPGSQNRPKAPAICDPRLEHLRISRWTAVDIDNGTAAKCISLYLQTDHPLLGHFDPDLFLDDLLSPEGQPTEYCSSLLVNSLLYWACVRALAFWTWRPMTMNHDWLTCTTTANV